MLARAGDEAVVAGVVVFVPDDRLLHDSELGAGDTPAKKN